MRSTAVLVSYVNTSQSEEAVYKVPIELSVPTLISTRFLHIIAHSDSCFGTLLASLLLNSSAAKWIDLMERVSLVIPTHADVYWIVQDGGKVTGNEEFSIWETYCVKDLTFVQPVLTTRIQDLSYLGKLVDDKSRRRQDFRGSVITATAVVSAVTAFPLNLRT